MSLLLPHNFSFSLFSTVVSGNLKVPAAYLLLSLASTSDCNLFLLPSSSLLLGSGFNGIGGSVFCAFSAEESTTADISNYTEQRFLRICHNTVSNFPLCFLYVSVILFPIIAKLGFFILKSLSSFLLKPMVPVTEFRLQRSDFVKLI